MEQRELSPIEKDIAEVAKLLNAEYIESLKEKLEEFEECLLEAFKGVMETLKQTFGIEIDEKFIALCRDPRYERIVWLSLYHPKERVRKKNIRRIKRIAKRMKNA